MRSKILLIIILLCFYFKPANSFAQVNTQDSLALVDFYDSTDGSNWSMVQWNLKQPVTQWQGVTVTGNRVTALQLSGVFRSGKIPSSFGNLTELQRIYLLDCRLTEATLPESFGNLVNLRFLKMSAVFWNLPFPESITKLRKITEIDFQDNFFTDALPSSIANLGELRSLNLSNCFTLTAGPIPPQIGNIKNLQHLFLNSNNFSGSIPESFASLDSLETLELTDNKLTGAIPSGLNNLTRLSSISANNNQFTFQSFEPFIQAAQAANKTYAYFTISPQANISITRHHKKLTVSAGGTLANNTYKWHNGSTGLVVTINGDSTYTPVNKGNYFVEITNTVVPDLTLNSDTSIYDFLLADTATTIRQNIIGTDTTYINDGIFKVASLKPVEGANALTGDVTTTVVIDNAVGTFNNQPYVQRHYDISPALNASKAEAIVTLYFTQQDFDNYNSYITSHNPGYPLLPTGGVDNGNVRITQFHGSFTASPDPGNYASGQTVSIKPAVGWNPVAKWWELTFYVKGFSGFFVNTVNLVLPVSLIEFKGEVRENKVNLQWLTANEINTKEFIVEHSLDGNDFNNIGVIKAASTAGRNNYQFTHLHPSEGMQFYRLKMADINGQYTFSNVIKVEVRDQNKFLKIYPNPVTSVLNLKINSADTENKMLKISDASGKIVYQKIISVNTGLSSFPVNIEQLPPGVYHVSINVNGKPERVSFVKE